jgi:hypothetical protein
MGGLQVIKSSNGEGVVRDDTVSGRGIGGGSDAVAMFGGFVNVWAGQTEKVSVPLCTLFSLNDSVRRRKPS